MQGETCENREGKLQNLRSALTAGLTAGLSAAAMSAPALAQVDEIIVTAQKRAENIQDAPISIIAVTGDTAGVSFKIDY